MSEQKQVTREFRHAIMCNSKIDYDTDAMFVKEILHCDGKTKPHIRMIENYQRPYWLTKTQYRDHKDKKEFEYASKLDKFYCNQRTLAKRIFKQLNRFNPSGYVGLRDVSASPYVYGTDVTPPVLLAHEYSVRYPNTDSAATLMSCDFEWDFRSTV